jgi:hypothetical protein
MSIRLKSVCLMVVALISISSAFAQNNISSVYQASLSAELASCPLRDQILRVNQLAALEYVDRAFFEGLMARMNALPSNASVTTLGFPSGVTVPDLQSSITQIFNQLNVVASWVNSTILSWCPMLTADDQSECYPYLPCTNYTFNNLTSWSTARVTDVNVTGTVNGTVGLPSISTVQTALRQGVYFSVQLSNFIIASLPLISNSTVQQQMLEFEVMHAEQASYLQGLTGSSPLFTPSILLGPSSSSNGASSSFNRPAIIAGFGSFIPNTTCCDGWRNVAGTVTAV